MKFVRKFPDAETRDEVLAIVEYGVLSYTEGSGIKVKPEGSSPVIDYSIPFYVENIANEAETLNISETISEYGNYLKIPVEYSIDGINWSSFGTTGETPLTRILQPGEKVYLRATTNTWYLYDQDEGLDRPCKIIGISKIGGNIMSLLYGSEFTGNETELTHESTFAYIFSYNKILVDASELVLPATTLVDGCYTRMFDGCTSLTQAPELPATTLASSCYDSMFNFCTSLATAPMLPAITLAISCYQSMFWGCTSLTQAPELPATTLAGNCYYGMFYLCTSLTQAPELPATTLVSSCYLYMFQGCNNLNYIKCLATDISTIGCLDDWVSGVSSTGIFIKNSSMTNWPSGTSGIPSGWTVQDAV